MNVQDPNILPSAAANRIGIDNRDIDRERQELSWLAERSLVMHKLSKEYFGFRAYWFQFLPLLSITTATTIIGFLTTGMVGGDGQGLQDVKDLSDDAFSAQQWWLTLSLGILGAISTFITSVGKHNQYEARCEMHTMAERALQTIGPALMLGERGMEEDIKKQKVIYIAMEDACTSEMPHPIVQAFNDLDTMMQKLEYDFQILHRRFYNVLWKEFTGQSMGRIPIWPLRIPEIDLGTSATGKLIRFEYENFKKNRSMLFSKPTRVIDVESPADS